MQEQIAEFTSTLKQLSIKYSDPAVIVEHMPFLSEHEDKIDLLMENKEIALAGLLAVFVLLRLRKMRRRNVKPVAMVLPAPYVAPEGETQSSDQGHVSDPTSCELDDPAIETVTRPARPRRGVARTPRRTVQTPALKEELTDEMRFAPRPVFTAEQARLRAMLDAALKSLGSPAQVMAGTSLASVFEPAADLSGSSRAQAQAFLETRTLDFGLFDRAGRLKLVLHCKGPGLQDKGVAQVLQKLGVPAVTVSSTLSLNELRAAVGPYINSKRGTPKVRPAMSLEQFAIAAE